MAMRQLPVVLVTGFLGSGKTTLLNHLLTNDLGLRLGVVVNDFGAINIDQSLVAGQVDTAVSLSNGCLCCAVDASGLDDLLGQLASRRASLDAIVVEASGLAEPLSIVRMVRATQHRGIAFGGCVHVIDGHGFDSLRTQHPELDRHPAMADLVVLNKVDLLDGPALAGVRDRLAGLAPSTPVVETVEAAVDPRLLFDLPRRPRVEAQPMLPLGESAHDHLHHGYRAVEVTTEVPLDPRRLVDLLRDPPSGCYRIKGHVRLSGAGAGLWTVQVVGSQIRFAPRSPRATAAPSNGGDRTELVLIGPELVAETVRAAVIACEDPDDSGDGARPIERYVAQTLR
ncbi:MAG TPA: GTP-binding protein [Candidatus Avipropionibacterium avicola]|uniref:GTP-binding protein n=1 Tax=Candidatus Avipropionibacterium avicola TaxID=2840701 RepID=A0A9D1GW83_9ACTN|nr:GTP-binding protein [Candidatus Avipropionibacterium avicola]